MAETGRPAAGVAVAVGAFDAHMGAVGAGIKPGTLVKIIGTSTCDMMVAPLATPLPDIPGLCGIVPGSIFPACTAWRRASRPSATSSTGSSSI